MAIPVLSPRWWRERRIRKEIERQTLDALRTTQTAWLGIERDYPHSSLNSKIEIFAPLIADHYRDQYPLLFIDGKIFWSTVLTGISATGTVDRSELSHIHSILMRLND